jgi:hypothetical protein
MPGTMPCSTQAPQAIPAYTSMGRELVGQVLALGAQAIIGTAETELRRV